MIATLVMPKMSILIFEPITAIAIMAITARTKVERTFILFFMIYSAIEVLLSSASLCGRDFALFPFPPRFASEDTGGVGLAFCAERTAPPLRSGTDWVDLSLRSGAGAGSSNSAALNPPPIWKSSLSETPDTFGSSPKTSVGSSLFTLGFGSLIGATATGLRGAVRSAGLRLRAFSPLCALWPLLGSKRPKSYFLSSGSIASASFTKPG